MPTAASWTEARAEAGTWTDAVRDLGHLVRFRVVTVRRPRALALGAVVLGLLTLGAATLPALVDAGADQDAYALDALTLLPTALAGFVVVATAAAVATGGGRELLERDPAAVHPISVVTEHLGALLLAPLNLVWILQAWLLLAATAYAVPPTWVLPAQVGIVLWLCLATAFAQLVAWSVEAVRRTRHGTAAVRALLVLAAATVTWLQVTHRLTRMLDALPTRWLVVGLVEGPGWSWALRLAFEVTALVAAVLLGAVPARVAVRRTPREELRVDSGQYAARPAARTGLGTMVRLDRASVWRAVPLRRGVAVLAVGPALAALIGQLTWSQLTILPGLLASGAALLFGVNTWCLDGRGILWRESLPVAPVVVFAARTWVLAELLVVAAGAALVPAVRAGRPTTAELSALLCTGVVVVAQVLAACMRWSARRPSAADLRSPRSTPAPPLAMVGYSAKLAITTTLTSLVFSGLARQPDPRLAVLAAAPFVLWSCWRLVAARDAWVDPVQRVRVTSVVAG